MADAVPSLPPVSSDGRLEISEELRREWLRLVAELRHALHASVDLDAPPGTLRRLGDRVLEVSRELSVHASGKPVPLYRPGVDRAHLEGLLPFSPIMGAFNPLAPPLALSLEGDRVVGRAHFGPAFQGAHGLVHGGVVAATFDEVLAMATFVRGVPGPTASLTVHYRKPVPLDHLLRFEAEVDRVQRRKVHVRGQCRAGGETLAEAEALFVRPSEPMGWSRRSVG